ncbi:MULTISPECIES: NtaA/DmoA family FMN-dependent monooxygenase [unclassified Bacillus (in: firmicutes)]|uniref:NtaA/DmoA family FMN-dependent monooxygenase n=1 Tax=unclassified Bacillus (in: firmicutes) TaxID=185979 RepID=UPI0022828CF2|nr:NtaA/DmoA family FMN-dependent monooxygenase [Bacillus sp. S20C3]MCY8289647.1 NtaA/DmoA family FMN-dependent monooxygenase [Bacillus sp. N13C7]MCY8638382.1 NtaA/DmoA family FMN-dependent monooxygenase [Bacillus sp. S17B2]MCY9144099.1 NtaA/DmoA family FMN-dependent monooxygenase [Bacillus sp. T9C1]
MSKRQLKIGFIMDGVGLGYTSWRHPNVPSDAGENIDFQVMQAKLAESGKFDMLFITDLSHIGPESMPTHLSIFEGVSLLSALSMMTENIGLGATIATSFADPFTVARQMASLDKISHGRAAWNAVTSLDGSRANNFSRSHITKSDLYPMQKEFMEIVERLWDSYEDDAFIRDKRSGIFLDPTKMHPINYRGHYFSVDGPLPITRSPQGRPVIIQVGTSEAFLNVAAHHAEAVMMGDATELEYAKRFIHVLKEKVKAAGRSPHNVLATRIVHAIVGETEADARRKVDELERLLPPYYRMPDNPFFGSAEQVAEEIEKWYYSGAMDLMLLRQTHPETLQDFIKYVVPILQEKGIFRKEYESNTLRGNLGLPYPQNRYSI